MARLRKIAEGNSQAHARVRPNAQPHLSPSQTQSWTQVAQDYQGQQAQRSFGANGSVDPYKAQFDSYLNNATNGANRTYGYGLADSLAGESQTALNLGANLGARDPNADPSAVTSGTFDWNNVQANNPFSQAALLVREYQQAGRSNSLNYANRGQLYSSALGKKQADTTFGYQQGQDTLQKQLLDYLTGQARSRRDAGTTRDETINTAGLDALKTLLGGG